MTNGNANGIVLTEKFPLIPVPQSVLWRIKAKNADNNKREGKAWVGYPRLNYFCTIEWRWKIAHERIF